MKVTKEWLLPIAGVVWSIAGFNITRLGIMAYGEAVAPVLALAVGSVAVFTVFWTRVFSKMLHKHIVRIQGYGQEAQPFWRFFDTKSYIIMAIMMGGGISLRAFGLVPSWFIAFFTPAWALRWAEPVLDSCAPAFANSVPHPPSPINRDLPSPLHRCPRLL